MSKESKFEVSLSGLNLTKEQISQIDKGIKEVVMRELAKIDHKGDMVISRVPLKQEDDITLRALNPNPFHIGATDGIWVRVKDILSNPTTFKNK
jgi:hypothetical protein